MFVAKLRHKLRDVNDIDPEAEDAVSQIRSLIKDTSEDMLTADVFGLLKYLPAKYYFEPFLRKIDELNPHCEPLHKAINRASHSLDTVKFDFWPNYPTHEHLPGSRTEPDVEISSDDLFIFVEAKVNSPFGERQIERQLEIAKRESRGRECFVVLVTGGIFAPQLRHHNQKYSATDYIRAVAESGQLHQSIADILFDNASRVAWIGWEHVQKCLRDAHQAHREAAGADLTLVQSATRMLGDFFKVMELRGFKPYQSFRGVTAGKHFDREAGDPLIFLQKPKDPTESVSRQASFDLQRILTLRQDDISDVACGAARRRLFFLRDASKNEKQQEENVDFELPDFFKRVAVDIASDEVSSVGNRKKIKKRITRKRRNNFNGFSFLED